MAHIRGKRVLVSCNGMAACAQWNSARAFSRASRFLGYIVAGLRFDTQRYLHPRPLNPIVIVRRPSSAGVEPLALKPEPEQPELLGCW